MGLIQAQNLGDVFAQIFDVVTDTANAKLAKVAQILPNLRGVEIKLLGQRLRRNALDPGGLRAYSDSEDRRSID